MVQYWASLVGFLTSQSNTGIALQIAVFSVGIRIAKHAKASQGISRTLVPLQCILLKQHRNRKKSLSPRKKPSEDAPVRSPYYSTRTGISENPRNGEVCYFG